MPWLQRRCAVAEQEQHRLWRQARMKNDIQQFISKMSELEIVDSFIAIERHLLGEMQSGRANADSEATCQKLMGDLLAVFNVLPKDMQQLLLMNPQRAALLQENPERKKLPGPCGPNGGMIGHMCIYSTFCTRVHSSHHLDHMVQDH